jgi:hypothetical protein
MRQTAQQKFNAFLNESRETSQAVTELITASHELYGNYAYACGFLESMVKDVIAELPKARRAEVREQFLARARKLRNERLVDVIAG